MSNCKNCKYWESQSWLCTNASIGGAPHNEQGMRLYEDACIKPADDVSNPRHTFLYAGPMFGCIYFKEKWTTL
jgi:hypothetical protein